MEKMRKTGRREKMERNTGLRNRRSFAPEYPIQELTPLDRAFPDRLREIPQSPGILYIKGSLPRDDIPSVAIIGARDCTPYGREVAFAFGKAFSGAGVQVISGMAYGIDTEGQKGAIQGGGHTFSVFGNGVDVCYPVSNFPVYEAILQNQGGLISEFPENTAPLPRHFAARNRIIAGLSDAVIVIEAKQHSGTFITVGHALNQGKPVFALPGRISDRLSQGCHQLIKEGAYILSSIEDVFEVLELSHHHELRLCQEELKGLNAAQKRILSCMEVQSMHMEELLQKTGISREEFLKELLALELLSYCESPKHGYYRRKVFV